jgi:hypothetical protein
MPYTPEVVKEDEKFILTIKADHNDADYRTETTIFKVEENFDLVELLNVLKVLRKLQQAKRYSGTDDDWHIAPMYHKLSEEDVRILFEYDRKRVTKLDTDASMDEFEEYSLMDCGEYCYISQIRSWFPYIEDWPDYNTTENIQGNHSLISIKLQYNDGNGNLLNIEL